MLFRQLRYFEGRMPEDELAGLASLAGDAGAARGGQAAGALCGFGNRCLPAGRKQAPGESACHGDGEMAAAGKRQRKTQSEDGTMRKEGPGL